MPRSPSTYSLPPGTTPQQPNTVISSSMFNAFADDVAQTFNTVQPIVYGGTGVADGKPLDNTFGIKNSTDLTKIGVFNAANIPTATALTYNLPTSSGTLALTSDIGNSAVPTNLALSASVAGNALTISIKGFNGNDPSASNPVSIPFRSATAASGDVDVLTLTAATSLVISSGSTMGFTSAIAGRLWIVGFNDAGTFRLGAVNVLSGTSIMALRDGIYSTTAEGGAGGADSAQVIYTSTAVASKAMTILGYMDWSAGLTTAGTWAIVPTNIQVHSAGSALPGEVVQQSISQTGALASGATTIPFDNTIPQITEGDQYLSQAITPMSAANVLAIEHSGLYSSSVINNMSTALFQDATASALAASNMLLFNAGSSLTLYLKHLRQARTVSSTTFRIRSGGSAGGTTLFNGTSGAAVFGGVAASYLSVQEIMA